MFCKHDWEILSETTTKSKYESCVEIASKAGLSEFQLIGCARRKLIQIVACKKCGKLKRFVEDI